MPSGFDLDYPITVPEKPALEGLEDKWRQGRRPEAP
jgi:hypothetical protein